VRVKENIVFPDPLIIVVTIFLLGEADAVARLGGDLVRSAEFGRDGPRGTAGQKAARLRAFGAGLTLAFLLCLLGGRRGLQHDKGVAVAGGWGFLFALDFLVDALDVLDHLLVVRVRGHFPAGAGRLLHLQQGAWRRYHDFGRIREVALDEL